MSKLVDRVEIISGIHRRRRYTAEEKVRLVELDLSRFCATPLIQYCVAKEMNDGYRQDG
jgi:hypothetical protein